MFVRNGSIVLAAAVALVTAVALLVRPGHEPVGEPPIPPTERTREQLDLRDGLFFERAAELPFSGLLVGFYPGGERKVAIEIRDGRPHGRSRGWYGNGQLEVDEHFVAGVAHGPRTRWYENGRKRSEATIENGRVTGTFVQWHDNGQKAAEATLVDGEPDGVCLGWHRSGRPKSRVELRAGEVVHREYWDDRQAEVSSPKDKDS